MRSWRICLLIRSVGYIILELAKKYLESLLRGDRETAARLILDAVEKGESIRNIYLHVFQRTQYEIGRLWYLNRISVAEEHFATAATQLIMSQLYPYVFSTKKTGSKLVAACAQRRSQRGEAGPSRPGLYRFAKSPISLRKLQSICSARPACHSVDG